jgi:hypothetical protein
MPTEKKFITSTQSGCLSYKAAKNRGRGLEKSLENRDHQWHNGTRTHEIVVALNVINVFQYRVRDLCQVAFKNRARRPGA